MNNFPTTPLLEHRLRGQIHNLCLFEESMLLAAIQRGDDNTARRIINDVFAPVYSASEEQSDLLKGLLLKLMMIWQAVVERGAMQSEVLSMNSHLLIEMGDIDGGDDMTAQLRKTLKHIFSREWQRNSTPSLPVGKALDFMRMNLYRDISRDETARHAGISPSHFSRLLKGRTGRSFTELRRQYRVDLACDLLRSTEQSLAQIADACGFCDQAYFTRVFQDMKGMTPKLFRLTNQSTQTQKIRTGIQDSITTNC